MGVAEIAGYSKLSGGAVDAANDMERVFLKDARSFPGKLIVASRHLILRIPKICMRKWIKHKRRSWVREFGESVSHGRDIFAMNEQGRGVVIWIMDVQYTATVFSRPIFRKPVRTLEIGFLPRHRK